jgi:hypothetical protein
MLMPRGPPLGYGAETSRHPSHRRGVLRPPTMRMGAQITHICALQLMNAEG